MNDKVCEVGRANEMSTMAREKTTAEVGSEENGNGLSQEHANAEDLSFNEAMDRREEKKRAASKSEEENCKKKTCKNESWKDES